MRRRRERKWKKRMMWGSRREGVVVEVEVELMEDGVEALKLKQVEDVLKASLALS